MHLGFGLEQSLTIRGPAEYPQYVECGLLTLKILAICASSVVTRVKKT